MNKRRNLYESIMRNVAKTVKRSLRESVMSLDDLDNEKHTPAEWEHIANIWKDWNRASSRLGHKHMTPRFWKEFGNLLSSFDVTVDEVIDVLNDYGRQ